MQAGRRRGQHLQMVKQHESGRLMGVKARVVYGEAAQLCEQLREHSAYVVWTHLTSRQMNGRLMRKTLGFSETVAMSSAACIWEDMVYNFARSLKTLHLEVQDGCRR